MLEDCIKKGSLLLLALLFTLGVSPLETSASAGTLDASPLTYSDNGVAVTTLDRAGIPPEQETEKEESPVIEAEEEQAPADPRIALINSAELNSQSPQSPDLDDYLHTIMAGIITDDMTTYDQVKACYDYLVNTTRYGSHTRYLNAPIGNVTAGQISSQYGVVEGYGAVVLSSRVGMCNAYASAFILMADEIGLDAYLVKGSTRGAGGRYVYHEWAEVNIDGNIVVFDPQLEQNLTAAGLGTYNVFSKPYSQLGGRYSKY